MIAVTAGQMVRRGQVISYVGSTGLSTGPHLHYELYRGGRTINPASVKFTQMAQLSGAALSAFKARLADLKRLPVGLRELQAQAATGTSSGTSLAQAGGGAPKSR